MLINRGACCLFVVFLGLLLLQTPAAAQNEDSSSGDGKHKGYRPDVQSIDDLMANAGINPGGCDPSCKLAALQSILDAAKATCPDFGTSGKAFGISTGDHDGFTDKSNNPHINIKLVCKCQENPQNWLTLQECIATAKHEDVHSSQVLVVVDESPPPSGASQKEQLQTGMLQLVAKAQDYLNEAAAYALQAKYLISLGNTMLSNEDKAGVERMTQSTLTRLRRMLDCANKSMVKYNTLKSLVGMASGPGLPSFDQGALTEKADDAAKQIAKLLAQSNDLQDDSNFTFHGG